LLYVPLTSLVVYRKLKKGKVGNNTTVLFTVATASLLMNDFKTT
jgi:hypothetical protein